MLSCLCSTSIILCFYVSFLIVQQLYLIINSQTWHEYKNDIQLYKTQKNLQSNFKIVLGKQWYLILFSPLISSNPIGDAMSFDLNVNEVQRVGTKRS